jgi:ABC-2 type transport system permease protein
MRCLSEERRTGTLEVLLTSPVNETAVVLSKFLATFLMYLIMWLPMIVFLVALRIGGGSEFDYRPVLSFGIALTATGAAFTAMGVFCSSVSSNQIISAVLAFAGMLILTMAFFLKFQFADTSEGGGNLPANILEHVSYIDFWFAAMEGKLMLRSLIFPLSMTAFFLFLNVKVLEARRWK